MLAALGILAAAAFLESGPDTSTWLRLVTKPVPVLCLAAWVAVGARGSASRLFCAGLLFSALGDWLLERSPDLFLAGLIAFLAAHLAYLVAFLLETRRPCVGRALPFALWAAIGYVAMRPGLGSMAGPVLVYLTAIAAMMWRAAAGVGRDGTASTAEGLALLGAVLFGASDTLIGLDRFRAPIDGVHVPIMLSYWLGQLGIAASAVADHEPR